jgi:hypothetical protein
MMATDSNEYRRDATIWKFTSVALGGRLAIAERIHAKSQY